MKISSLLRDLVRLFDGVPFVKKKVKPCACQSGRVARFKVGDTVDCVVGPFAKFERGKIVRVVSNLPVDVPGYLHCSGVSAHYFISIPHIRYGDVVRYDWELKISPPENR